MSDVFALNRRSFVAGAAAFGGCTPQSGISAAPPIADDRALLPDDPRIAAIESRVGGRVGVAAFNGETGAWLSYRARERFAMCSTFKWCLAAMALQGRHAGGAQLSDRLAFTESDLLAHAPVAREHVARGWLSVEEACAASVIVSDNTAANLLLGEMGGPQGFTAFMRRNGDGETRLDRMELELNENAPGDPRDTTTPHAMARTLHRFLASDSVLRTEDRETLIGWMVDSTTGRERLRAGLPGDWRVGDKTGMSTVANNATNDVAIAFPPGRAPIVIAAYMSHSTVDVAARNQAHAEIGRIIAEIWS